MVEWHDRVFIAEIAGPWLTALLKELQVFGFDQKNLFLTEHGVDVQRAILDQKSPPKVIVVSHQLQGMGGLEAIYLAHRLKAQSTNSDQNKTNLCLITEVRSDVELLNLFSRRGVRQFVYRDDPVELTAQRIVHICYGHMRTDPRFVVRIKSSINLEGSVYQCGIENISKGGCLITLPITEGSPNCTIGHHLSLDFSSHDIEVKCAAEIRQVSIRKRKMSRDALLIGVKFDHTSFSQTDLLEKLVERVRLDVEGTRDYQPVYTDDAPEEMSEQLPQHSDLLGTAPSPLDTSGFFSLFRRKPKK